MFDLADIPAAGSLAPTPAEAGQALTAEQQGHIRHLDNLSRLPDNDWSGMLQRLPGQEDGSTLRYQLGYSAFALALAHVHRLPAAPGLFKPMFLRLIKKIMLPPVWLYWRDVSKAGGFLNPQLHLPEEWDPVARDNIYYGAYLQAMVAMFGYLFGDQRFAEPESIILQYSNALWGGSEHRFTYDRDSLTQRLAVFDPEARQLTFRVRRRTDIPPGEDDEEAAGTVRVGRLEGTGRGACETVRTASSLATEANLSS